MAEVFAGRKAVQADFLPLCLIILVFTSVRQSIVLEHAIAISVVSVAEADCPLLGDREGKPSRACLVVWRPVHSRSVRSQHPEKSTLGLVLSLLSLQVDRHL